MCVWGGGGVSVYVCACACSCKIVNPCMYDITLYAFVFISGFLIENSVGYSASGEVVQF